MPVHINFSGFKMLPKDDTSSEPFQRIVFNGNIFVGQLLKSMPVCNTGLDLRATFGAKIMCNYSTSKYDYIFSDSCTSTGKQKDEGKGLGVKAQMEIERVQ
jgi:lipopolysaccharide assembly outer membrane protein LptD (OstA)